MKQLLLLPAFSVATGSAFAQGDADMEAKFIAMLKNSTLKGTWAPITQGQLGSEKKDGDNWAIVSLFKFNDQEIEYPIPAVVKFAGDTAVLILNNVRAGPGQARQTGRHV